MTCITAVGVNDHLPPGESRIGNRATDDEASRRVEDELDARGQEMFRYDFGHHGIEDLLLHPLVVPTVGVMGRDEHLLHGHGPVAVVANHHLSLAIRSQIIEDGRLANLSQTLCQTMSQLDR